MIRALFRFITKSLWILIPLYLFLKYTPSFEEMNPVRIAQGMVTSTELMQIERALENHYSTYHVYPQDLEKFLAEHFVSDFKKVHVDSWGTPYRYEINWENKYVIRSAGPDRLLFTDDDYYLVHEPVRV